jgi:hypothetical protein
MKLTFPLLILLTSLAQAATLKVGVVDSGLNLEDSRFKSHLCRTGHRDFTGEGISDTQGHGTAMVGLITRFATDGDYCLVIYKYYSDKVPGYMNVDHEVEALRQAAKDGIKIVNLSGGGPVFNEKEYLVIRDNPEITFVVAAGNEGQNLDVPGNEYYPAMYYQKNEVVVENIDESGHRTESSNYGSKITVSEVGVNVYTTLIHGYGYITGTSASTAVHTGKLIRTILNGTN